MAHMSKEQQSSLDFWTGLLAGMVVEGVIILAAFFLSKLLV